MDLKDLTPKSDDVVVTIKHPLTEEVLLNDDGSEMTITVYAPHSKDYKKVLHALANARIKKVQKKGKIAGFEDMSLEELEEMSLDTLSKTTKEWNITFGGECPKLTLEKAKELYTEVFWIKAQIEEALNNYLGFMKV